jgi:hypothetical protein
MGFRKKTLALHGSVTTGTSAPADIIPATLVEDYAGFSVQISGTFSGSAQWHGSNDGTTWFALRAQLVTAATQASIQGATTAPALVKGYLGVRYFKVVCATYTSGTIVADVLLTPDAPPNFMLIT